MTFYRIQEWARRCRERASRGGCMNCGKVLPLGLFLEGTPSLTEMARSGVSIQKLKEAIRKRGWYCRGCMNLRRRVAPATATVVGTTGPVDRDAYPYTEEGEKAFRNEVYWRMCPEKRDKEQGWFPGFVVAIRKVRRRDVR